MPLQSQLESILFVASKPLSVKKIAASLKTDEARVEQTLEALRHKYDPDASGVVLLQNGSEWQMTTNPDNREAAEQFMKADVSGELTRPQLETLTVISYCGPITKPELERIRGVNCSLILRNLMIRGLVKEVDDGTGLLPTYEVTMDFLRHLGIGRLQDMPDYQELHKHPYIANAGELS